MEKQLLFVNWWIWKKRSSNISIMAEEEYGKNVTVKIIKQYHRWKYHKTEKKLKGNILPLKNSDNHWTCFVKVAILEQFRKKLSLW